MTLSLLEVQDRHIIDVLNDCEGNKQLAARLLGISPKTIYNVIDRLGDELIHDPIRRLYIFASDPPDLKLKEEVALVAVKEMEEGKRVKKKTDMNELSNFIYHKEKEMERLKSYLRCPYPHQGNITFTGLCTKCGWSESEWRGNDDSES